MHQLQHDHVVVAALASGSRGNCTYIGTEDNGVLIDCGLSTRQITTRMEQIGLGDAKIRGILITHEHSDHVGSARVLDKAFQRRFGHPVPFYMTPGTRQGLNRKCIPSTIHPVTSGRCFQVGPFMVEAWTIPHDTLDPVAYAVSVGSVRAGVITDLGRSTRLVERQLASLDIAVLEFNHDLDMLLQGAYPWRLKQRVKGGHGHLSNSQAADILRKGASSRLKHLILGHLSEDNNTPELALKSATEALLRSDASQATVHVANQKIPIGPMRVRSERTPAINAKPRKAKTPLKPRVPASQLPLFG